VSNSGLFCPTGLGALTQCKVAWSFPSCFYDLSSDWNHLLSTGPLDYRVFCLTDGKGPRSTLDTVKSFQMVYPQCWIISWYCAAVCTIAVLLFCKWLMEGPWCRTLHQHQWRGGGGEGGSLPVSSPVLHSVNSASSPIPRKAARSCISFPCLCHSLEHSRQWAKGMHATLLDSHLLEIAAFHSRCPVP
jgi:hypothetical protein